MSTEQKLELIKRGVKANIHLVKDMTIPLCGGTSEASREAPTVVFIYHALNIGAEKDEIIRFLKINDDMYENYIEKFISLSNNWKFKQKKQLVSNYIKYHG